MHDSPDVCVFRAQRLGHCRDRPGEVNLRFSGAFFPLGGGENRLRLSYSMPSVEQIREEIRWACEAAATRFPGVLDENPSPRDRKAGFDGVYDEGAIAVIP